MAMCMPSGSFMGTGYEEIIHFHECIEDGVFPILQSSFDPLNTASNDTSTKKHKKYSQKESECKKIIDIQNKLRKIKEESTASKFWIENMQRALDSLKNDDAVSTMRFLIAALIDAQENHT